MNAHIGGGINSENLRVSFLFHLLLTNGKWVILPYPPHKKKGTVSINR